MPRELPMTLYLMEAAVSSNWLGTFAHGGKDKVDEQFEISFCLLLKLYSQHTASAYAEREPDQRDY